MNEQCFPEAHGAERDCGWSGRRGDVGVWRSTGGRAALRITLAPHAAPAYNTRFVCIQYPDTACYTTFSDNSLQLH